MCIRDRVRVCVMCGLFNGNNQPLLFQGWHVLHMYGDVIKACSLHLSLHASLQMNHFWFQQDGSLYENFNRSHEQTFQNIQELWHFRCLGYQNWQLVIIFCGSTWTQATCPHTKLSIKTSIQQSAIFLLRYWNMPWVLSLPELASVTLKWCWPAGLNS